MIVIFSFWKSSLDLFTPNRIISFFKSTLRGFWRALKLFARNFGWLIALDLIFSIGLGDIFAKANVQQLGDAKAVGAPILIMMLIRSVIWFLTCSALFLLLRKNDSMEPKTYFKYYFFRYVQMLMLFAFSMLILISFLVASGVTMIPTAPWWLLMLSKIFEFTAALYWLDGSYKFSALISSLERTTNLIFYNIPFMLVMFGLLLGADYGLSLVIRFFMGDAPAHVMLCNAFEHFTKFSPTFGSLCVLTTLKYFTLLLECWWLSMLIAFYRRKKDNPYTTSIFKA